MELEGDVAFVQSQNTGRFYVTTKRCFIFAAIDEPTARALVGTQLPVPPIDPLPFTTVAKTVARV